MASILRVRTRWTGFTGAPGYTILHFGDFGTEGQTAANSAVARTVTFFNAIRANLPTSVRIQVEGEVDLLEDTTGDLTGSFNVAAPAVISGTGGNVYSAPVGAVVNWRTNVIRKARRVRGRSFLVPLTAAAYGADGQLLPAVRDAIQVAANALADATQTPDLGVYARETSPGSGDGQWAPVTSSSVPNIAAVLRSRRD